MTPQEKRRAMAAAMANQWDKPTFHDQPLQRRTAFPVGVYQDGGVGLAVPEGAVNMKDAIARLMARGYTPGDDQAIEDAAGVAGTIGTGTLATRGITGGEGAGIFGGWLKRGGGPKPAEQIAALQQEIAGLERAGAGVPPLVKFQLEKAIAGADEKGKLDFLSRYRDVLNENMVEVRARQQAEREAGFQSFKQQFEPDKTPALTYDPRADKGVSADADPVTARMRFEQERRARDMMAEDPAYRQKLYEQEPAYAYSGELPGMKFDREVDEFMQSRLGSQMRSPSEGYLHPDREGVSPLWAQKYFTQDTGKTIREGLDTGAFGNATMEDMVNSMARRGYNFSQWRSDDFLKSDRQGRFQTMEPDQREFRDVTRQANNDEIRKAIARWLTLNGGQ